jgi:hypothetical protein
MLAMAVAEHLAGADVQCREEGLVVEGDPANRGNNDEIEAQERPAGQRFFAGLTSKQLRRSAFRSTEDLERTLRRYLALRNHSSAWAIRMGAMRTASA